ncbi:MAG: hypothetical protein ACRDN0_22500, partial [Trebonia sp.]
MTGRWRWRQPAGTIQASGSGQRGAGRAAAPGAHPRQGTPQPGTTRLTSQTPGTISLTHETDVHPRPPCCLGVSCRGSEAVARQDT